MPLAALIAASALYLHDPLPLQVLRNVLFDQYQRWHPRPYRDTAVRIVDLDDRSLTEVGQWPWPRPLIARLVERLHLAGATVIAFDVMFAEPDRTSPRAMLNLWKLPPETANELAKLPDHDTVMAAALRGKQVVLGFAAQNSGAGGPLPIKNFGTIVKGVAPDPYLPAFTGTIIPLPQFGNAAAGSGAMTFVPDSDGVVRRVPLLIRVGDTLLPSLAAEALRVSQNEKNYHIRTTEQAGGIEQVRIGRHPIPTTANGEAWVHFSKREPIRTIPAWQVLSGQMAPGALQGKIVLIGTSAQGLQDLRFSPLGGIIPGVEVHAQLLEQVLTGAYLNRPAWAVSVEALVILAGGILICAIALQASAMVSALLTLAVLAALNWAAWNAFVEYHLLFDSLTASIGLALMFIATSILRHVATERSQRWVREAFSRYVSPNLVKHLVDNPSSLQLGGKRQACSFVFTDLAGFTSLMEKSDAGEVVALLNVYLEEMIKIAFRHEGTLDRIVGDSVAIMFSAPVEQVDHASRALACAIDMHRFASAYAKSLQARNIRFGQTRIGVHCGEVVVGNFGGSTIFDYRALGDPVNTASRLESLNQHIGTLVCVSGAIQAQCPDVPMRPVGKVVLKGKSIPLPVFEPIEASTAGDVGNRDTDYEAAFALMTAMDATALAAFERLHQQRPGDGLVALHLNRLRHEERGDLLIMESK
ncbi:MAG: adenylate/guanylate cyclase with Chase sensor [Herminiimonas sp.]|nr:adenylate/guanylate cyclase with Chase sensor [Herminiimonas sp.]